MGVYGGSVNDHLLASLGCTEMLYEISVAIVLLCVRGTDG